MSGTSREAETGGLSSQQWDELQQDGPHSTKDSAACHGLCSRDQKQLLRESVILVLALLLLAAGAS